MERRVLPLTMGENRRVVEGGGGDGKGSGSGIWILDDSDGQRESG